MNTALVIVIENRFFYGFGKKKQVLTAWTLAGAKLYQDNPAFPTNELSLDIIKLSKRNKPYTVKRVFLDLQQGL